MERRASTAEPFPRRARAEGPTLVRLVEHPASDDELVQSAAAGEAWAASALLDRYGAMVERLLRRVLGHDPDLEDLVQDAFANVLGSIGQVREGAAVKGWIASIAVHTAHRAIRRRKLARWLAIFHPASEPVSPPAHEPREALRRVYELLDRLPTDERIAFTLRYIEEMPLEEVAVASGVSLATIKRRLSRAEGRFVAAARVDGTLRAWLERGDRWTTEP
jgi:RNA polymerase sigma-70 factor (ECF subfamily)